MTKSRRPSSNRAGSRTFLHFLLKLPMGRVEVILGPRCHRWFLETTYDKICIASYDKMLRRNMYMTQDVYGPRLQTFISLFSCDYCTDNFIVLSNCLSFVEYRFRLLNGLKISSLSKWGIRNIDQYHNDTKILG